MFIMKYQTDELHTYLYFGKSQNSLKHCSCMLFTYLFSICSAFDLIEEMPFVFFFNGHTLFNCYLWSQVFLSILFRWSGSPGWLAAAGHSIAAERPAGWTLEVCGPGSCHQVRCFWWSFCSHMFHNNFTSDS